MAQAQRGHGKGGGHPLMTGMVVGLLLGLCLALALAVYLLKSNPFVARDASGTKKESKAETAKPDAGKGVPGLPTGAARSSPPEPAPAKPAEPRFGFYEMLPKADEGAVERKPGPGAARAREVYYLQAGAFQKSADADNLKARLALAGLEAQIVTATVGDSVWHRVRLGPFDTEAAMNEARGVLRDNRIEPKVIKSADAGRG